MSKLETRRLEKPCLQSLVSPKSCKSQISRWMDADIKDLVAVSTSGSAQAQVPADGRCCFGVLPWELVSHFYGCAKINVCDLLQFE